MATLAKNKHQDEQYALNSWHKTIMWQSDFLLELFNYLLKIIEEIFSPEWHVWIASNLKQFLPVPSP